MSSPWLALTSATTSALTAVSASASVLTNTAEGIADLAAYGATHARVLRIETEQTLMADMTNRMARREQTLAVADARFYRELKKELAADPELAQLYSESLASYRKGSATAIAP